MKQRNVNTDLQIRIRRYVEYIHEEEKMGYQRGDSIYKSLSNNLRDEIWIDSYSKLIKDILIFKNNFTPEFIKNLSTIIEEKNFAPGEIILNPKSEARGIFIIIKGEIKSFVEPLNNCFPPIQELNVNSIFHILKNSN